MARNRKYGSASVGLSGPLKAACLLLFVIVGVGGGYVWQKNQITQLGQQIKKRELYLAELRDQNEKLRQQLAKLRSPAVLESRVRELNLGLMPVGPHHEVFTLVEPQPEPVLLEGGGQYAAQQATGATFQ